MTHILSVAAAAQIIADRDKVRAAPQQLVAVPIGALVAMLVGNAESVGLPPSVIGIALTEAVKAAEQEFGTTYQMHIPEPMPA